MREDRKAIDFSRGRQGEVVRQRREQPQHQTRPKLRCYGQRTVEKRKVDSNHTKEQQNLVSVVGHNQDFRLAV